MKTILRAIPAAVLLLGLWACGGTSDKCLGSSTKCDGTCVSLKDDVMNCGTCGNACADGQTCSAGTCAATCATGYDVCGDICADLARDAVHCGSCDNACAVGYACVFGNCNAWESISQGPPSAMGWPDFVPSGADPIYVVSGWEVDAYSISGDSWSAPSSGGTFGSDYAYPAWVGDNLYSIDGGNLYAYSISGNSFSFTAITDMPTSTDSQATSDGAGNLYALADDGTIIGYNLDTSTLTTWDGPTDLSGEERAAWDQKTGLVYLGVYSGSSFYSFDPTSGTVTALPSFPSDTGMSDAFCSDRQGHIYTADAETTFPAMFDTATGTWSTDLPPFPYPLQDSGGCTVTADGYLYYSGAGATLRMQVFTP